MIIAYGNKTEIKFYDYIKNRLARIYPVYLLAILLFIVVTQFKKATILDLFLNISLLQSWIPNKALTLNIPGWSLSVEFFFYIAFPILVNKLYSKFKLKVIAIWIICFWLFSQLFFHLIIYGILKIEIYSIPDLHFNPIMHFNQFLIGNLSGLFFVKKLQNHKNNYLLPILVTSLILILLLQFPTGLNYHDGLLAIIFIPLILLICSSNDKLTTFFSKRVFIFLGEISFGIYMYQGIIWKLFSDYRMKKYLDLDKEIDFTNSFLVRLFILIMLSSLSYLYFEKPLQNKIKNFKRQS